MRHARIAALAATMAVAIGTLAAARPVSADALYVTNTEWAGTWGAVPGYCDNVAWSQSYELWYILRDDLDYVMDIPDPDFTSGTSVEINLEPAVVGTLNGSVTLSGADTISDTIPASNPWPEPEWGRLGAPAEFVLTFTPGTPTTGVQPVPNAPNEIPAEYTGFAAVRATITTTSSVPDTAMATDAGNAADLADGVAQQTIVILAQGFMTCETPEPTPEPTPAMPSPTADGSAPAETPAVNEGDPGVAPAASIALATSLLMLGVVNGRALRRRR